MTTGAQCTRFSESVTFQSLMRGDRLVQRSHSVMLYTKVVVCKIKLKVQEEKGRRGNHKYHRVIPLSECMAL